MKCDFCSSPDVICGFEAPDIEIRDLAVDQAIWGSIGGWAACEPCAQLMEAGKLQELAKRAMDTLYPGDPNTNLLIALLLTQYTKINRERKPL